MCRAARRGIFRYITRLYKHNKLLAVIVILFALLQLINNIRQDIAISPVYSYGMYSERINPSSTYIVPEVFVNGKQLQTKNYTPQQWDNIIVPVSKFYEQKDWNSAMWQTDIRRLLPFSDSTKFLNTMTEDQFKNWYKNHLPFILNEKVDTINISFNSYQFNNTILKKTTY